MEKVLKDLDLEKIMTAQAKNLSGGQKRKLSVGIAILGDPKVPGVLALFLSSVFFLISLRANGLMWVRG